MMRRPIAVLAAAAATLAALAAPAGAGAVTSTATSSNWAGYAISGTGLRLRRVASTWVQPTTACTATGRRRYSAAWLGLGGYHTTSRALEQIGTEADCTAAGTPSYSAWYELVPAAPVAIPLTVRPGDTLSASVTVTGHTVKLYLANRTRGTVFTKRLTADRVDVTSAEWIVEAPSACYGSVCAALPLADFGTTSFAGARATTALGHSGAITDPAWAATAINLGAGGGGRPGGHRFASGAGLAAAVPGDLAATGDGFTVTYTEATPPSTEATPPSPPVG
jgi:Peptidase A4 family